MIENSGLAYADLDRGEAEGASPLQSSSLVNTAFQQLRKQILSLKIAPGTEILETEAAAMLGMSRTPVREAMIRLTYEGLLEPIPRRGSRVAPITARDVREINEVLACLEIQAVVGVASRQLSPAEMASLDEAIAAMDSALRIGDMDAWAAADFRFHSLQFELCSNRHLSQTARLHLDKAHRSRLLTLPLRRHPVYSNSNHAAVVEAIRRGDPETARDIHSLHKQRWSQELDLIIEQYPDLFDASKQGR